MTAQEPLPPKIPQRVEIRKAHGTIHDVATLAGVSIKTLERWESGTAGTGTSTKIAEALGIPPSEYGGRQDPETVAALDRRLDQMLELLQDIRGRIDLLDTAFVREGVDEVIGLLVRDEPDAAATGLRSPMRRRSDDPPAGR